MIKTFEIYEIETNKVINRVVAEQVEDVALEVGFAAREEVQTEPTPEELREQIPNLSARQIRLGLLKAGITPAQVTAKLTEVKDETTRQEAMIEWDYASTFKRMHPLILLMGEAFGWTPERVDAIWEAAVEL